MSEIRLSKLTKQFNIGLQTLVDFLKEKGADVELNPNAKISDSYLPAIESKFGEEQKLKQDSEKVAIKLKEIIEMGSKKKNVEEEDDEPVKEIIIKSTGIAPDAPVQQAQAPAETTAAAVPVSQQDNTDAEVSAPEESAPAEKEAAEETPVLEKAEEPAAPAEEKPVAGL